MNIFIDTEFTCLPGIGSSSELIAIGIYCEDDSSYYGCLSDFNQIEISEFVKEHVLPLLPEEQLRKPAKEIRKEVLSFLSDKKVTSVWATYPTLQQLEAMYPNASEVQSIYRDFADWDFKLLLKLLKYIPDDFPSSCENIACLVDSLEPDEVPENKEAHNALQDAIWNFKVWKVACAKACT